MRRAILLLAAACGTVDAQIVTALMDHGDPANRIDIVLVGDGYTASELAKFASDANRFAGSFFEGEVYREYASYFNVRTVAVASNQSGASHPELNPPQVRDTAFNATYNCAGVARLICVNYARVTGLLETVLPASQRDFVWVLVNDPAYGGAGGAILVSSTHAQAVEVSLHESGHTIGLLADEYTDQPPICNLTFEPGAANATKSTDRARIKWNAWIAAATPVPTTATITGVPGLFEGADYCPNGKYRPTYNSKMRSLGRPFEAINNEQLVRRFYNAVSPIDGFSPSAAVVTAVHGARPEFRVTPLAPASHALAVSWSVDGVVQAREASFAVDTSRLSPGLHTVRAVVQDATTWVRSDPEDLLSDSQSWQLIVTAGPPPALASFVVTPATIVAGSVATASFTLSGPVLAGGPLAVDVVSSSPALQAPSSVAVQPGQTGGTFAIQASTGVEELLRATLTVSYDGTAQSFTITVMPPPDPRPVVNGIAGAALSVPPVRELASGSVFSVFGSDFAAAGVSLEAGAEDVAGGALPLNLAGTCVEVGGRRASMIFVSPVQINAIAPTLPASGTVPLTVIAECGTASERISRAIAVPVRSAAPEFLYATRDADGRNFVIAIQSAIREDVLTLFGVGFGATTSSAPPGTIALEAAETAGPATVTIGGVPTQVLYAGLTPSVAGLYQVNLVVPAGLAAGAHPIGIEVNGGASPAGAYLLVAR